MSREVIRYQDSKSILVVSGRGQLRHLHTPFRVQCVKAVESIPLHCYVYVDEVYLHRKYLLLYWINQKLYPYHHFAVNINW